MSSAGHIMDMIKKLQANKDLQRANKGRLSKTFGKKTTNHTASQKTFNSDRFPKKSSIEIHQNRSKILASVAKENKVAWLKTLGVTLILILLFYFFFTK